MRFADLTPASQQRVRIVEYPNIIVVLLSYAFMDIAIMHVRIWANPAKRERRRA
jgi:hypothetical protein